jgi:environmental stress-induced protein Ves
VRTIIVLPRESVRRMPWKNGRGVSAELALWPEHGALERLDFDWRISASSIDEAGGFSAFPGFDRILVVTHGDGLVLTHGEHAARVRLRRCEPYLFAGDWRTEAVLANGRVEDLNVVFRRDACRAEVEVWRLGQRRTRGPIAAAHAFVHVISGSVGVRITGEDERLELGARASAWIREPRATDEIDVQGLDAKTEALLVRIGAAAPDGASASR